jgi:cysteine desulfurase
VFTSGATESNNLAIAGLAERYPQGHIITSPLEHASVLEPLRRLESRGYTISYWPVDSAGRLIPGAGAELVRDNTFLVSLAWANNEIGVINPLQDIGPWCNERKIWLHVDGTQAVGRLPIDLAAWGVDLLSFSAHKFHGPLGVGGLFIRQSPRRARPIPRTVGGGQERGWRSGTLNVPGIVGMAHALELTTERYAAATPRLRALRDDLFLRLRAEIPDMELNGPPLAAADRLIHNLNCEFPGIEGQTLMLLCPHLAISSGSACSAQQTEPSHVLLALNKSPETPRCSLRFGLSYLTTESEIADAATALIQAYHSQIS